MAVILLVLFNVRWRLLPLGVVLVGVIWAFGIAGYLGIPLTIVTIAGLPVMLGIGIDYAIQMHARVEEEVVIDRAEHPIQETSRNLGPALLVVTFDAIFAFAALHFAKVPMLRAVRPAARHRRRRDLPEQHHRARSRSSASASTGRRRRAATSAKGALGRLTCAPRLALRSERRARAGRRQPHRLRRRHPRRGQARAADRPDPVGQPALAGDQGPRTCSNREVHSSSELGVYVAVAERVRRPDRSRSSTTFTRTQLTQLPRAPC